MSEPTSRVDSVDPAALPALRPPSRRLAQLAYLGYDALGALGAVAPAARVNASAVFPPRPST
jgi:hypothetical protein